MKITGGSICRRVWTKLTINLKSCLHTEKWLTFSLHHFGLELTAFAINSIELAGVTGGRCTVN